MSSIVLETIPLLQQVASAYEHSDDAKRIMQIKAAEKAVQERCDAQQAQMKEIIAAYCKKVDRVESDCASELEELRRLRDEQQRLMSEGERIGRDVERERQQLVDLEQRIKETKREAENARRKAERAKANGSAANDENASQSEGASAKTLHALSLYSNISNIRWDFNATGKVKGFVTLPKAGELRPFNFDGEEMSQFEITNRIWELMDP